MGQKRRIGSRGPPAWTACQKFVRQIGIVTTASTSGTGAHRPVANDRNRLEAQTRAYRPCVVCGQLMHRRNYAKSSGVLIDECREHGAWFDLDELAAILAWIRAGGLERQARRARQELRDAERRARMRQSTAPADPPLFDAPSPRGSLWLLELLFELFSLRR